MCADSVTTWSRIFRHCTVEISLRSPIASKIRRLSSGVCIKDHPVAKNLVASMLSAMRASCNCWRLARQTLPVSAHTPCERLVYVNLLVPVFSTKTFSCQDGCMEPGGCAWVPLRCVCVERKSFLDLHARGNRIQDGSEGFHIPDFVKCEWLCLQLLQTSK